MTEIDVRTTQQDGLARAEKQAEREAALERADVQRGSVGRLEADEVSVQQGAIGLAQATNVTVTQGAVGAAIATDVSVRQGFSRFAAARNSVRLEQAGAMTVVANNVEIGRQSGVVFLIARNVTGDVRTLFDWRAGLAFGAAAAVVASLLRALTGGRR